ncbi:DUF4129 domain-containing transglutaminase family protein [Bacillus chungangensis]|uniref:Ca2+/Na+ antiporter n=1 Tax=Bacillus chungangensis TaxID=587633 RepID=A0ABT9WZC1_9BACI|nr:DUF4129 domain-containing transglutaminase family protein [Bacillus chungangensis]MDQ0178217.1 Ca2+/Na+ antiporter [Bacillus chungangensis]
MIIQKKDRDLYKLLLYVLGFLLLWEWLHPVNEITDTGNVHFFILFAAICFFLYYFDASWVFGTITKGIFILLVLHHLYFNMPLFRMQWLELFFQEVWINLLKIVNFEWYRLSDIFRSLLFFILLWLIIYLIQYWITVKKQIFIFYVMTILYITVLDTFTLYNGKFAIIRTVIVGFSLLGILYFIRLSEKEHLYEDKSLLYQWLKPLLLMIAGAAFFAYVLPKAGPIWPDPAPMIQSASESSSKQQIKKVGYGEDDSKLGGPFEQDNRIVFEAIVPVKQYWRIETKNIYTGKGWLSNNSKQAHDFMQDDVVPLNIHTEKNEIVNEASLVFQERYPHIVYPYGIEKISTNEDVFFSLDDFLEKITPISHQDGSKVALEAYTIQYRKPIFSVTKMSEVKDIEEAFKQSAFYLQHIDLPNELPDRVYQLAEEITKDKDNWFDKVKAVEKYFKTSNFVYDQQNVAMPKENEDYVDQFLFETQQGYCDNFSTSMVVLLRTIGIPARWAKGYTAGTRINMSGAERVYKITNNNAHSWVEVFFPNVGWVPFEPTKGFDNNASFDYDFINQKEELITELEEQKQQEQMPKERKKEMLGEDKQTAAASPSVWKQAKEKMTANWWKIVALLFVILIIGFWIYRIRSKWIPPLLIYTYRKKHDPSTFIKAYIVLLKQLDRIGLSREEGQTLRDYAHRIDRYFGTTLMSELTAEYEHYLYSGKQTTFDWCGQYPKWKELMKKTAG